MRVPIETSARHVHLSREDFETLFGKGKELTVKTPLSQPGQYACEERVTLAGPKGTFERVSVLGPFRSGTQVEISMSDARKLGVDAVIRQSGDTGNTPGCTIVGPEGKKEIPHGVIVAKRHIHMTPEDAQKLGVEDGELVSVQADSQERSLIFSDVVLRISPDYSLAMHVDTDEANAFAGGKGSMGIIRKMVEME